jgi:hypothetical protein
MAYEVYRSKVADAVHGRLALFLRLYLQNPKEQFMKTRCALKILYRIRPVFPREAELAKGIRSELVKITAAAGD